MPRALRNAGVRTRNAGVVFVRAPRPVSVVRRPADVGHGSSSDLIAVARVVRGGAARARECAARVRLAPPTAIGSAELRGVGWDGDPRGRDARQRRCGPTSRRPAPAVGAACRSSFDSGQLTSSSSRRIPTSRARRGGVAGHGTHHPVEVDPTDAGGDKTERATIDSAKRPLSHSPAMRRSWRVFRQP